MDALGANIILYKLVDNVNCFVKYGLKTFDDMPDHLRNTLPDINKMRELLDQNKSSPTTTACTIFEYIFLLRPLLAIMVR